MAPSANAADQFNLTGLWKTFDDDSGKEKSIVSIIENDGVTTGRIERLLDPDALLDARCRLCRDDKKDQPLLGMTIIQNIKRLYGENAVWIGSILDPETGTVYQARFRLRSGGKKLVATGYIGLSLLGRDQIWVRVE